MTSYCGCLWSKPGNWQPQCLPQVSLKAHATILSSVARTTLIQTFVNPSDSVIEELSYHFPLYDGISVVGFKCKVGSRLLHSKVKTKSQANADYQNAVAQHQTAAVMDHTSMGDVFVIRLGNVPARGNLTVDITFVGELKQDSQRDGIRYTLPSTIAPRYGTDMSYSQTHLNSFGLPANLQRMSITVDVQMEKGSVIRELESPSHRIKVSLGRVSSTPVTSATFEPSQASAFAVLQQNHKSVVLEQDLVVLIKADGLDTPCALLERHPTIPNQRALMATLVPKFSLRPASPEVVFVIDRSASMVSTIPTLRSALQVFLKSLPVGICFNICSFGHTHCFMWEKSQVYDALGLQYALDFVDTIDANMGGTEMKQAVIATVNNRLNSKDLDVLILTDGQIYDQDDLFDFVREKAADNTARFFSLGIGEAVSHSLIEGIARAGNGFSQSVTEYEELDRKVVRMLKGALTPHVNDYKLEVEYDAEMEQEFDFVSETEEVTDSEIEVKDKNGDGHVSIEETARSSSQPISLFDENFQEPHLDVGTKERTCQKLPTLSPPRVIQAPYNIPPLYPFVRTTVFLLLDPHPSEKIPKSLKLSATSNDGPLELRIPVCNIGTGETIHQLASRKAVIELEEGHGWLPHAIDENGNKFKQYHTGIKQRLVEHECQSLGIKYQVTGKYCSFVALEECSSSSSEQHGKQHTPKEYAVEHISPISNSVGFSSVSTPVMYSVARSACTGGGQSIPYGGQHGPQHMHAFSGHLGGFQVSNPEHVPTVPTGFGGSNSLYGAPVLPSASKFGVMMQAQMTAAEMPPTSTLTKTPQMRLHDLIQLQTFDGSWIWSSELFELLGCNMNATITRLAALYNSDNRNVENGFPHGDEATVLATLLAMGSLQKKHSASRTVWELVHAKASEWVQLELTKMQSQGFPVALIASIQDEIVNII
ncbi:von Willebrand factor, type A [Penicillium digitatum]|uniref:von Willebrand domain-containing protein n=3 Tax=Penicillium digitatum TaxID=36651 RepID=K9FRZ1_PEND2|nr:hypothetical protein PDIP_21020 [Penicillium digitatum Pd1]EKV11237.1 hypothetical protein PDIG_51820 [Penicillium digitatum PHI26]EKV19945.1 hypothetical protein PDIP_21020 [Penicillium digitatum Pd1]KAG0153243.1 hypothetical protein PDIDSM_5093 [Penicillium digitatum]QQK39682.1 von Willebrand factor, type A [Penicillium digitatum]